MPFNFICSSCDRVEEDIDLFFGDYYERTCTNCSGLCCDLCGNKCSECQGYFCEDCYNVPEEACIVCVKEGQEALDKAKKV